MKRNNTKLMKLKLNYYSGLLDQDELEIHKIKLRTIGVELLEHDKSGIPMAFLDEFTNQVSLTLSNPVIQAYILGLLTNGGYDVLKSTIIWMWKSLMGKQITKIYFRKKEEKKEATFGLHVEINEFTNIDLRLSGDVSDELKSKCIDKAFEFIKVLPKNKRAMPSEFAKYDWDKHEWFLVNVNEEIKKLIKQQKSEPNNNKSK